MAEAGRPLGVSISRFSTCPSSPTITTSALPGAAGTNSICLSAPSCLGATTRPAQRDRPESMLVAWVSTSSRPRPVPATRLSMAARSSGSRSPISSSPSTKSLQALLGRHAAGAGVRRGQQAQRFQIRHHIADRGRRQRQRQALRQGARADRLARGQEGVDQMAEHLARPFAQLAGQPPGFGGIDGARVHSVQPRVQISLTP